MPYIYSVYEVIWNKEETEYEKRLICTGTPEQIVEAGSYKSKKVLLQAFGENIRSRQKRKGTRRIFEREWKPEPGEVKPQSTLPDSVEGVYPALKNGRGCPGPKFGRKKAGEKKKSEGYSQSVRILTPLERDVHLLMEDNDRRAMLGKKPLSYGQWRAGLW